jgi:2-dehydro-3-deoxygluconokinase
MNQPALPINIRSDDCQFDFLALGALVHRLDPGHVPFRKARQFDVHVSGGEYNVAANLADCFGRKTAFATAMVDYPVGALIQSRIREMGVTPFFKHFVHDGVRGPNMATVYSDRGHGVRAPIVFYNRANEAAALLEPGDFDWPTIMADGVRWFHSGGIFAALSETTPGVILEGLQAAKSMGAIRSFDLNYRDKLWATAGGANHAQQVIQPIVENVDVLIGNEEDLQRGLGILGPRVERHGCSCNPTAFFNMIDDVIDRYPHIQIVATTLREVISTNRHRWSAVMWCGGQRLTAPVCDLDVLDRIGGGDGFASGLIFGLLDGRPAEEALGLGWAHGALLTTYPGDVTMATLADVEAFVRGKSARVER